MLTRLLRDQRGLAALEFAFIAPVMAGMVALSYQAWQLSVRQQEMNDALKAGVQYYMNGGKDDTAGKSVADAAWSHKPTNGAISVSRACVCGTSAHDCTTLCSNTTVPEIRVTLAATGTYPDSYFVKKLATSQVVRVR